MGPRGRETRALVCDRHLSRQARASRTRVQPPGRSAESSVRPGLSAGLVAGERPGLLRYDNALPLRLVRRLIDAFSNPGELIVDPMVGSGTTMIACHQAHRRFVGCDLNPAAIHFAAARLLDEHVWPAWRRPQLFAA